MKEKTSHRSGNSNVQRKPDDERNHITRENMKEQHQRTRSTKRTRKR